MIPSLFTSGSLISPGAALISSGYVAGSTLGAQHLNWYLNHLTLELNNLLTAGGVAQNTSVDTQVSTAVQALIDGRTSAQSKSANFNVGAGTGGARRTFLVTTGTGGAGNVTATLPVLSGANGRVRIVKVDTGTNEAIADGNGTEKIGVEGNALTFELYNQGDWVELEDMGAGAYWAVVGTNGPILKYTSTADVAGSTSAAVWANPTGHSLSVPPGIWEPQADVIQDIQVAAASAIEGRACISTGNSTSSDAAMMSMLQMTYSGNTITRSIAHHRIRKSDGLLVVAATTTYYLNIYTGAAAGVNTTKGTLGTTGLRFRRVG